MSARIIPFPQRGVTHERYLTITELAETLGMSERWIFDRRREGMPSHKYGRSRRYLLSEVQAWLHREERAS